MKILFLTPEYPHPAIGYSGGIGTNIKNLAGLLGENGHDAFVLVYGHKENILFYDGKTYVEQIKLRRFRGISWLLARIDISKKINQFVQEQGVELVEVPDWTGISAFMRVRIPIVMRLNGSDTYFCNLEKRRVKLSNFLLEKIAYSEAKAVTAVSRFVGEKTQQLFNNYRGFSVIPNSIDIQFIDRNISVSAETKRTKIRICYFGSLNRKKGVLMIPLYLNELLSRNRLEFEFYMIGRDCADSASDSPSTLKLILSLLDKETNRVFNYLGEKSYLETLAEISTMDICIFPSYAEALPLSWLEAMSMNKCVVASNIGWSTEIITHGADGLICDPNDCKQFVDNIEAVAEDFELRRRLGVNARNKVEHICNNEKLVRENIEFYQKVLSC